MRDQRQIKLPCQWHGICKLPANPIFVQMLRASLLLILLCSAVFSRAEQLLYRSDAFEDIRSGPVLWLDSCTEIYCYPTSDVWCKSVVFLYIMPENFHDGRIIKRNTPLYDHKGVLIGKTYETFTYSGFYHYSGDNIVLEFNCFLPLARIKPESFIEKKVSDLLNHYRNKLTIDSCSAHLSENDYFRKEYNEDVVSYIFFEKNKFQQRDDTRLKLIFYKGQLAAVMLKRSLQLDSFEAELEEGDFRVYYLRVLSQPEKEKLSFAFKNDR